MSVLAECKTLIESLSIPVETGVFEGTAPETYAADNCGADWNEQAARMAQQYRDYSTFSHAGLVDQLEYEGFSAEQAEYGASATE